MPGSGLVRKMLPMAISQLEEEGVFLLLLDRSREVVAVAVSARQMRTPRSVFSVKKVR